MPSLPPCLCILTYFIRSNRSLASASKKTASSAKQDVEDSSPNLTSLMFNVNNKPGSLKNALQYFWKYDINLTRIESRPVVRGDETEVRFQELFVALNVFCFKFYVSVDLPANDPKMEVLIKTLKEEYNKVQIIGSPEVPWFPRRPSDIDHFSQQTLDAGDDLQSDHPGFHDEDYRKRRALITENARNYK
jgi:phenylalanine-4-hydroxylase